MEGRIRLLILIAFLVSVVIPKNLCSQTDISITMSRIDSIVSNIHTRIDSNEVLGYGAAGYIYEEGNRIGWVSKMLYHDDDSMIYLINVLFNYDGYKPYAERFYYSNDQIIKYLKYNVIDSTYFGVKEYPLSSLVVYYNHKTPIVINNKISNKKASTIYDKSKEWINHGKKHMGVTQPLNLYDAVYPSRR